MTKKSDDQYGKQESQRRFEAALRGARNTGHKTMADLKQDKKHQAESPAKKREREE
jgi:hypothetical protein